MGEIMEVLALMLILLMSVSLIIVSWGKQKEKFDKENSDDG